MINKQDQSEALVSTLETCGVDTEILTDLLERTFSSNFHQYSIVTARDFALSAVSEQISWNTSFHEPNEEALYFIEPKTKMRSGWRPKEETLQLLSKFLKFDRIEIGYAREHFIRANKNQAQRSWDCLFVQYSFAYFKLESEQYVHETSHKNFYSKDNSDSGYPEDQRIRNKIVIRNIITELLKKIDISPKPENTLDENWQPAKWIVKKLQEKFNLNKRFIYDHTILKPFISYYSGQKEVNNNYNILYFHWVVKRFKIKYKLLLEEKKSIEKTIQSNKS